MSEFDVYHWLSEALDELDAHGLRRRPGVRRGRTSGLIHFDGRELIDFGSNDYLGLAGHGSLAQAAQTLLMENGVGSGASPLITGRTQGHQRLEQALAQFEGAETALLFPTGYAANVGTIVALASAGDIIYSDARNHASIIDGCRLSKADVRIYAHGDSDSLRQALEQTSSPALRRRLIVTDSLFSMDGDLAPLQAIESLAREHRAMLIVDEAHATGVLGEHGRGGCEEAGIESSPVVVRVGTLSKALGCLGGFTTGPQKVIDWLTNRARSYFFSTAPPECLAAAALEALRIIEAEPQRRLQLLSRARVLREQLEQAGFDTGQSRHQIIPVILRSNELTMKAAAELRDAGLFVPGIRPPSVPQNQSLLRISLSYSHTERQIDELVTQLTRIVKPEA